MERAGKKENIENKREKGGKAYICICALECIDPHPTSHMPSTERSVLRSCTRERGSWLWGGGGWGCPAEATWRKEGIANDEEMPPALALVGCRLGMPIMRSDCETCWEEDCEENRGRFSGGEVESAVDDAEWISLVVVEATPDDAWLGEDVFAIVVALSVVATLAFAPESICDASCRDSWISPSLRVGGQKE